MARFVKVQSDKHLFYVESRLSDGTFYCVYRTVDGHPACSYSRDGGHTWSTPQYARYADGRLIKHPRAANFCWRCTNGKYLYWFHNHGGRGYEERNPAWLCGGIEVDTPEGKALAWSQPEIVLYDDDPYIRMSYPDLIEEDDHYYLTETQKEVARVHEINSMLLEGLWGQFENAAVTTDGLLLRLPDARGMPRQVAMPPLPALVARDQTRADYGTKDLRQGFTIDLWVRFDSLAMGQVLLDNRTPSSQGIALQTTARGTVEIVLHDGRMENRWDCDPGWLRIGMWHHLVVIVDGGPKIILFVIDGILHDGGSFRQFGWGRYNPNLRTPQGSEMLHIAPNLAGEIASLRLYGRALRVSEAVGNYRAGVPGIKQ